MSDVVILGAGMAGLGAAHRLRAEGVPSVIYDKNSYPGGHAASFRHGDFTFDDGPHVSFTRDPRVQQLFADAVGGRYEVIQTQVDNYWRGHWIKHPAQCNLHGLPTDLVVEVIQDFVNARGRPEDAANYEDWLIRTYGETFARTFPMVYGQKYHTATASAMTTDWLGPRLYRPSLEEVLRGALEAKTPDVHYVDHFRYPTDGGFAAFLTDFVRDSTLQLERTVESIDPTTRTVTFADGRTVSYRRLISSLPLPELIPRLVGAPERVRAAAEELACTSCVLVNLGVAREGVARAHWSYFYDEDLIFTRLSAPHLLSPNTVPPGASAIQAEIYYSKKYRPRILDVDAHIEPVIQDLRKVGLLRDDDEILHRNASLIPYANIIFDHDRPKALETLFAYLDELGIATCGRYGRWGYHWSDESFLSGEGAAASILETHE
ncbi:MAG: NAD(P)-binding protein [Acidobacteriota bacterium]